MATIGQGDGWKHTGSGNQSEMKTYKIKWESKKKNNKAIKQYQQKIKEKSIKNRTNQRFLGRLPSDIVKLLTSEF